MWGKWVDRNKGDVAKPNLRSRYVACEVATYRDDSMFAATPPLEALRLLLSHAAERGPRGGTRGPKKVLLMDVRKAHLHAESERTVYVHLPPELKAQHPGKCWLLRRCLYGTRDAPARWEALYTKELKAIGVSAWKSKQLLLLPPQPSDQSPCPWRRLYFRRGRQGPGLGAVADAESLPVQGGREARAGASGYQAGQDPQSRGQLEKVGNRV